MTNTVATSTSASILLATGDHLYVSRDTEVIVPDAVGIDGATGTSNGVSIAVDGTVVSLADVAIRLRAASETGDNVLVVGASGILRAVSPAAVGAISAVGSDTVIQNWGEITGTRAVYLYGCDDSRIENHGSMAGQDQTGVLISFSEAVEVINTGSISGRLGVEFSFASGRIENSGEIIATDAGGTAIRAYTADGSVVVVNTGHISSASSAFYGGAHDDRLVNGGSIYGTVNLGDGEDTYRGARGVIDGTVYGGLGDDVLHGGAGEEVFEGEDGGDDMLGRGGDDVLSGGNGVDTIGGGAGDDVVSGGNGGDTIRGATGDDVLSGEAGADVLNGGKDDDTLTGGGGADVFVFNRNAGFDVITDFENGVDRIDLSAFGIRAADYASIVAPAISNAGGAVVIDLAALGGQGSILVEGLGINQADASDFVL